MTRERRPRDLDDIRWAMRADNPPDAEEIASQVFGRSSRTQRDQWARMFLETEAYRARRDYERSCEREARSSLRRLRELLVQTPTTEDGRIRRQQELLSLRLSYSEFSLGGGRRVSWQEATVSDHEERIEYLKKQRDAINGTIDLHKEAVSLLKEAGVSCLREVTEGVPA